MRGDSSSARGMSIKTAGVLLRGTLSFHFVRVFRIFYSLHHCISFAESSGVLWTLFIAVSPLYSPIPCVRVCLLLRVPLLSMVVPRFFCVPFYDLARSKCLFCPSTHATPFPCPSFSLRLVLWLPLWRGLFERSHIVSQACCI